MRKLLLCLCVLCLHLFAFGQKEWSNWYNDGQNLLTFKNGYPENVTNFIPNPPPVPPYENLFHFYHWGKGGISYSDPVTGSLKFIISNRLGYGKDYKDFPNDTFIRSCPDQKSYHIIPFSNDPDKFYVIQFQSAVADLLAAEMGLQVRCPNAIGLGYSIVDMSMNGGLGDFASVNNVITTGLTEQITLVKHANGQGVWVIVHPYNTAQYRAYLVSGTGVQPPVTSTIGVMINGGSSTARGELTASHDGKLLAGCRSISAQTGSSSDIELFNFDNATGILSNYRSMPSQGHVIKLCFSPDNTKLYAAGFEENYSAAIINQWDFNQANVAASKTTVTTMPQGHIWDMQLAPDGKIYLLWYREYLPDGTERYYLPTIQCPNLPKYACNFKLKGFQTNSSASFPSLVNDFINQPPVIPTPTFSIGNDTAICFGSLTITAPAGWQSYRWNTGDSSQSITVTAAGTYHVLTGNTGFSCPEAFGYIKVSDKAIKLNLGKDTTLCSGAPYLLQVPNGYTNLLWNNGSNTRDSVIYGSGTIIISALDINGCYTRDTIVVGRKYYPIADFGPDTTLCNSETLLLKLQPPKSVFFNAVYSWQNNSSLDTFRVTQPGTFWGTVTFDGCTASDTINVQYVNGAVFTLGADTVACAGDSITLTAPLNNASYLWSNGATTQSIKVYTSGQYSVSVALGLCTTRDTIQVTFQTRPVFSLGNDTTLCEGNSLLLQTNLSGGNFLWQDGSALPQFSVNAPGLYWLQYRYNACSVADSIQVSYKNKPALNLGKDSSFCAGEQMVLQANNAAIQSYLWQDQSTSPFYTVTISGNYFVTATGFNGCTSRDTISIMVIPPPVFNLGNDTSICAGKNLLLAANVAQAQFLWNTGNSTSQQLVQAAGLYWLKVTLQGCSVSDSIVVNVNPVPVLQLGKDTVLCEGATILLNAASANTTYVWQDGSTASSFLVNRPGVYYVVAKNANGCTNVDSINVKYTPMPVVTLGKDTLLCPGQIMLVQPVVNTPVKYSWQDGNNFPSYNVKDTGVYTVTVHNTCGTATTSIVVRKGICQLYIPNSFTPNNDNLNDVFRIKYPFAVQRFRMAIYNRYGQQIFTSSDIFKGWNGTYGGLPQSGGAYVWMISFTDIDGRNKSLQGTVLLLR